MSVVKKVDFYIPLITVILDFVAIIFAFYLAFEFRFYSFFESYIEASKGFPVFKSYMIFGLISLPIWFYVFQSRKMYRMNRNIFIFDEFIQIVKCATIAIIVIMAAIFFYRSFEFSRITFVFIWLFSIVLITLFRYFVIKLEQFLYKRDVGIKNVAVVGKNEMAIKIYDRKNEMAIKIYDKFVLDKHAGFKVSGYFANTYEKLPGFENKEYLGDYSFIPQKIKELKIEKLLISLSANDHDDIYDLMKICEGINIEFMMAPDYIDIITSKLKVEEVDGIPFMKLKSLPLSVWNRIVKRTFDIVVSLCVLIITLPVMVVISIIVKLSSKGPLLYKQVLKVLCYTSKRELG